MQVTSRLALHLSFRVGSLLPDETLNHAASALPPYLFFPLQSHTEVLAALAAKPSSGHFQVLPIAPQCLASLAAVLADPYPLAVGTSTTCRRRRFRS